MSRLVALPKIFRRLMKGKLYTYALGKKFQNWIVDRCTTRDFAVSQSSQENKSIQVAIHWNIGNFLYTKQANLKYATLYYIGLFFSVPNAAYPPMHLSRRTAVMLQPPLLKTTSWCEKSFCSSCHFSFVFRLFYISATETKIILIQSSGRLCLFDF